MFAHTEELDVLHHHHPIGLLVEQGSIDDALDIGIIAARQKTESLLGALGRPDQAFPGRIFADLHQQLLHQRRDGILIPLRLHHLYDCFVFLHLNSPSTQIDCVWSLAAVWRPGAATALEKRTANARPDAPRSHRGYFPKLEPTPGTRARRRSDICGQNPGPPAIPPMHPKPLRSPPAPSCCRWVRTRKLPARSRARGRAGYCTCRRARDSLRRRTGWNEAGAMPRICTCV